MLKSRVPFCPATCHASRRARVELWVALWLVLALVGAQSLGLMHRVVHSSNAVVAVTSPGGSAAAQGTSAAARDGGLGGLFFGHDAKTTCPLFDGLTGPAMAPTLALVVAPVIVAGPQLRQLAGGCVARWAALFDARGPPDFR